MEGDWDYIYDLNLFFLMSISACFLKFMGIHKDRILDNDSSKIKKTRHDLVASNEEVFRLISVQ